MTRAAADLEGCPKIAAMVVTGWLATTTPDTLLPQAQNCSVTPLLAAFLIAVLRDELHRASAETAEFGQSELKMPNHSRTLFQSDFKSMYVCLKCLILEFVFSGQQELC